MKGDFILRTNIAFIGKGVEEHRKIGWMVRSSLDTNSNTCKRRGARERGLTSAAIQTKSKRCNRRKEEI